MKVSDEEKRIGASIRAWRKYRRMTMEELAHATSMSKSHLGSLERGDKSSPVRSYIVLARELGITLVELLDYDQVIIGKQVEELLRDVPAKYRLASLRVLRESVLLHLEMLRDRQARTER